MKKPIISLVMIFAMLLSACSGTRSSTVSNDAHSIEGVKANVTDEQTVNMIMKTSTHLIAGKYVTAKENEGSVRYTFEQCEGLYGGEINGTFEASITDEEAKTLKLEKGKRYAFFAVVIDTVFVSGAILYPLILDLDDSYGVIESRLYGNTYSLGYQTATALGNHLLETRTDNSAKSYVKSNRKEDIVLGSEAAVVVTVNKVVASKNADFAYCTVSETLYGKVPEKIRINVYKKSVEADGVYIILINNIVDEYYTVAAKENCIYSHKPNEKQDILNISKSKKSETASLQTEKPSLNDADTKTVEPTT